MLKVKRALLSVYDKRGLVELARGLSALDIEILSTGGTKRVLEENAVPVIPVADVTGFPEILDGRVKTLHPAIHGGILADRSRSSHIAEITEHGIQPIDLVVVNLYPFRETASDRQKSFEEIVEMIDIGGPTMVRAAAKNHQGVVVVVDPDDYTQVLSLLEEGDLEVPEGLRRRLALKAFRHTQSYDAAIAAWLERQGASEESRLGRHLLLDLERELETRYGENPHQQGALYSTAGGAGVFGGFRQIQGKDLSYNNLLDVDSARRIAALFESPAVAIIKHNNPCGVGRGANLVEAYERALACDPVSAFGSVIAVNQPIDAGLAEAMADLFVEVVTAPSFSEEALAHFSAKANLRLLEAPVFSGSPRDADIRGIDGGFLAQTLDVAADDPDGWTCPTERRPTDEERRAMEFAWNVARMVKSNAIVLARENQTVGIGAGQMSRVDSCRLAVEKAQSPVEGTVAASDAFFPFRDGIDSLAAAGVTAVVEPGGSRRDDEVIAAADEHGMALLFTGTRHFRH
ncbi:MAG: bifunctional phosphoribosylaminoimidazolecarboxamide formyltransferase/IMP cyclohydrolase [Thermoanaerobaculia bacterium]